MLTISKPLSAAQVATYHSEEWANAKTNYYSEGDKILGRWAGQLREVFGLPELVTEEHFRRLAEGRHPIYDTPLIRRGQIAGAMEHRAGWDLTFSAPKSTSLVALVAGRDDVRKAHVESVAVALREIEAYTQARMGGSRLPQTTRRFVAATFEHDSARPVNGYAAPQLHTHCVVMNVTVTSHGKTRSLQPRELFLSQAFATAVYRSELAARLQALGYEIERGRSGQPEIKGFTPEYLEAASPRRKQILELLAQTGRSGAGAAQIAAHQSRDSKGMQEKAEVLAKHHAMAREHGDQPAKAVAAARERGQIPPIARPSTAVSYATQRQFERTAVTSERALLTDALTFGMGHLKLPAVRRVLRGRIQRGEFLERERKPGSVSKMWTIPAMVKLEQENIARMQHGRGEYRPIARHTPGRGLTDEQLAAVRHVLESRDRVMALDGVAGSGKTTTLAEIREAAERHGYAVSGMAPTSRAAQRLAEAGMETQTIARFLFMGADGWGKHRLLILDEASLASSLQMSEVLDRLQPRDRLLLVGDVRQHQAVEAGTPYEQWQAHGLAAAKLTEIRRQSSGRLRMVVEHLSNGRTREALDMLQSDGRVQVVADLRERLEQLTAAAMRSEPETTLIVVPDNDTRRAVNAAIHSARTDAGLVTKDEREVRVLVDRSDMTGTDRTVAQRYDVGDTVRYSKGSATYKIPMRSSGVVVDRTSTTLTVKIGRREITYNPSRVQGVSVYQERTLKFAPGDRIRFTAPDKELGVANQQLATVIAHGRGHIIQVRLDSGKELKFRTDRHPHLDYGYAMTSHSAQGLTVRRVIVHVDAAHSGESLVNQRLLYVALSRGGDEMTIFTDDFEALKRACARDISHPVAIQQVPMPSKSRAAPRGHNLGMSRNTASTRSLSAFT